MGPEGSKVIRGAFSKSGMRARLEPEPQTPGQEFVTITPIFYSDGVLASIFAAMRALERTNLGFDIDHDGLREPPSNADKTMPMLVPLGFERDENEHVIGYNFQDLHHETSR